MRNVCDFESQVYFINMKCTVEPLGMDTPLLRTVSNVLTKFSYISLKKDLYNTDIKSRPQRVNSYKLNLFITNTAVII